MGLHWLDVPEPDYYLLPLYLLLLPPCHFDRLLPPCHFDRSDAQHPLHCHFDRSDAQHRAVEKSDKQLKLTDPERYARHL